MLLRCTLQCRWNVLQVGFPSRGGLCVCVCVTGLVVTVCVLLCVGYCVLVWLLLPCV